MGRKHACIGAGDTNQHLRQVGVNAPIALLVGIGQGAARDRAADAAIWESA
ncbi:MAG: hypothetical protein WCA32_01280 [Chromatiaceae bacterium]